MADKRELDAKKVAALIAPLMKFFRRTERIGDVFDALERGIDAVPGVRAAMEEDE